MKKTYLILSLLVLLVLGFVVYKFYYQNSSKLSKPGNISTSHDATYIINGEKVTLKNGVSETQSTADSASKIVTRYFGNEVKHDLDEDGSEDSVFLLTQETGGSGIFYYVVAMLNTKNGPVGSQGLFLGDRIAPQTTELDEKDGRVNVIVVNYADRNTGESFTTPPSLGKSIWLKLDIKSMQFGIVVQNFEGESDPKRMTLGMQTWNWIKTIYNNDTEIKPGAEKKFTITFKKDGTFSATTDCNGIGGEYEVGENKISFTKMMSTLMYCENSQESDFTKMLNEIESYSFTSKGELLMGLKFDSGTVIFK